MIDLLVSLSIWDGIYGLLSAMMQPIYWVISGILVLFHALWAPVFGADSGWAWVRRWVAPGWRASPWPGPATWPPTRQAATTRS